MIARTGHRAAVRARLAEIPVVAILGARQVGKSTLARQVAERWRGPVAHFDLEDPAARARLEDPMAALAGRRGLVILDEIQRVPDLFAPLRVLVDRSEHVRFLVLGSAAPPLLRQSSETLAGRISYYELGGFSLEEVGASHAAALWLRGGFPRSYAAPDDSASYRWREDFIRTFLERDLPLLGSEIPSQTLGRFWQMLAHYHAQIWNGSELARAFGVSELSVRRYLDRLASTFVVAALRPWRENLVKRQVKSPKVYIADSGLLHALLRIPDADSLAAHPKVGASFEGFGIVETVRRLRAAADDCFFWATHQDAELDLLIVRGRSRRGFEYKRTTAPRVTRSMHIAMKDLKLDSLDVVHAGTETYALAPRIRAVALDRLALDVRP